MSTNHEPGADTSSGSSVVDAIMGAIREHADERGHAPLGDVVDTARREVPQTAEDIHDEIAQLQEQGEIYPVNHCVAITEEEKR